MNEKRKLNTFDIVFILIIVAAAAVLFFYFRGQGDGWETEIGDTVTYVLEVSSTEQEVADSIRPGDNIVDGTTKISLGTITDVEIGEVQNSTLDYESGGYILTDIPGKVSVRMTVEADITESASGILVEGQTDIRVSTTFSVVGPGYVATASVVYIERGAVK